MTTPKKGICQSVTAGYINFPTTPTKGHIHVYSDQIYISEGEPPEHESRFGRIVWRTHCATCGEPFTTYSGLKGNGLIRRCTTHRGAGKLIKSKVHPAAQGRANIVTTKAPKRNSETAATKHPRYAEFMDAVRAASEEERRVMPRFADWLKETALD